MVNPKLLCDQHLLGEHLECHMFVTSLQNGRSVQGYLDKGLLEIHSLQNRHDALAKEMLNRCFNHRSELDPFPSTIAGCVDPYKSLATLGLRCAKCQPLILAELTRMTEVHCIEQ